MVAVGEVAHEIAAQRYGHVLAASIDGDEDAVPVARVDLQVGVEVAAEVAAVADDLMAVTVLVEEAEPHLLALREGAELVCGERWAEHLLPGALLQQGAALGLAQ